MKEKVFVPKSAQAAGCCGAFHCNPNLNTWKAETGGLQVRVLSGLYKIVNPVFNQQNKLITENLLLDTDGSFPDHPDSK